MNCPKCGEELPDGAKYCHSCGPISSGDEERTHENLPDPSELEDDKDILSAYFDVSRLSYKKHPDNRDERAYLDNNRELFQISSYFDVPRDPTLLLSEWGLPERLRESLYLDDNRREAFDYVVKAPLDRNIVLIGDPGVGKTAILFAVFDELMKKRPVGVLSTTGISGYHSKNGIRLFYDDIPENLDMAKAIEETTATGIVVSAREQDFKHRLSNVQQGMFEKVFIRPFSKEDIITVTENLFGMQGLGYEQEALELVSEYARGTPIYVWSLVRDLTNRGKGRLTVDYLEENASGGMTAYINRLLMRLLRDGEEYKKGALHTLTVLVFLATQVRDKRSPSLYLRKVSDLLEEHTMRTFGSRLATYDLELQMRTLSYLSGKGKMYRFPHDCWADVLCGDVQSPFSSRIDYISQEFEISGVFGSVKKEALSRTWNDIRNMYMKHPSRYRKSAMEFVHFSLQNFEIEELENSGMKVKSIRRMMAKEQGHPLAEASLSIIERSSPSVSNMINIQDSVMVRSQIGQGSAGEGGARDDVEVRDAVVQRSTVGTGEVKKKAKDRCPECGNLISKENKVLKCKGCGKRFCSTCEGWIDKVDEYKGERVKTSYPLCEDCYSSDVEKKKKQIDERIRKRQRKNKVRDELLERVDDLDRQGWKVTELRDKVKMDVVVGKELLESYESKIPALRDIQKRYESLGADRYDIDTETLEKQICDPQSDPRELERRVDDLAGRIETQIETERKKDPHYIWESSKEIKRVSADVQVSKSGIISKQYGYQTITNDMEYRTNSIGMKFVKIPDRDLYMGVYPVIQREWKAVMGDNPSEFKGDGLPVESVSVADCEEFVARLNRIEGILKYRLPTEEEWEHACRAGTRTVYCFGDDKNKLSEYAWYSGNNGEKTHPVGRLKNNVWGLFDIHGNIFEWTSTQNGSNHVVRGGSWRSFAGHCRSANRNHCSPSLRGDGLGVRLVRSL